MADALSDLARLLAPAQGSIAALVSLLAFALVFAVTWNVGRLVRSREHIRRRALDAAALASGTDLADRRALGHSRYATATRVLSSLASNLVPVDRQSVSAMRRDLLQAGYFQPSALAAYYAIRVVLATALPAATVLALEFLRMKPPTTNFLSLLFGAAILGLMLPRFYVSHRRKALQQQSRQGFPDFMDLMVVCAEAGISMGQAIERVSRELLSTYPYLGTCLQLASLELRAGRTLTDAFDNLADRLGIEEAHNLGSLLKQSEDLGTSLSDALRVYSDEMRDKRMSRAEEKAHALPAKLSVPLMVFVFPVILIVILLPAYVRVTLHWG